MSVEDYLPTIGLEVHVQLATRSKLFSPCPYTYPAPPNSRTDGYTLGLPGELPILNRRAVELGLRLALAVGATPSPRSVWARKHYRYPDLPKGYQITQGDPPLALGGHLEIDGDTGPRRIPLTRIHLEEDAGKLIHRGHDTLVDFNRAGVALLEVVGGPALRSPAEAAAYLRELRDLVRALEISDATMETGSLRCDANVSLRRPDQPGPGTRCEIKNLNSFKFLEHALAAEIRRQAALLDAGTPVSSVTLGYDPDTDRVHVQRPKEDTLDYRYLPEPDLPPLVLAPALLAAIAAAMPELPRARRARYEALGIPATIAVILLDPALATYFDAALAAAPGHPIKLAHWLTGDLLGRLHAADLPIDASPVPPQDLAALVILLADGHVHTAQARELLDRCWTERRPPREILADLTHADPDAIATAVAAVLAAHPQQRAQYLAGKTALRGFFVGQAMRSLAGRADAQQVHAALDRLLADG